MKSFLTSLALALLCSLPLDANPIGVFPIIECPTDPFPQVVIPPSVSGLELAANQYVVCIQGVPQVFNCTKPLFFNWSTMTCDFPYERRAPTPPKPTNNTSGDELGNLDLLIPAGPITVPISPHYPIPLWSRSYRNPSFPPVSNYYPPSYPVTRPNPVELLPVPVHPALPPQPPQAPLYPVTRPNPVDLLPIPVFPAHPPPIPYRPIPYYYYGY